MGVRLRIRNRQLGAPRHVRPIIRDIFEEDKGQSFASILSQPTAILLAILLDHGHRL
jgi:hypothetical protein